jgi:hypothetical protein
MNKYLIIIEFSFLKKRVRLSNSVFFLLTINVMLQEKISEINDEE